MLRTVSIKLNSWLGIWPFDMWVEFKEPLLKCVLNWRQLKGSFTMIAYILNEFELYFLDYSMFYVFVVF